MTALVQHHDFVVLRDKRNIRQSKAGHSDGLRQSADRPYLSIDNNALSAVRPIAFFPIDKQQKVSGHSPRRLHSTAKDCRNVHRFRNRNSVLLFGCPHNHALHHCKPTVAWRRGFAISQACEFASRNHRSAAFLSGARLSTSLLHRKTGARTAVLRTRSRIRAPFHHNITSGECAS